MHGAVLQGPHHLQVPADRKYFYSKCKYFPPRAPGLEVDQQLSSGEGSKEEEWVVVARRGRWWTVTVKEAGR